MCIALITTAHPKYALIVLDNRDEYVLRPTSRPYWWTHRATGARLLSARDLYRREHGTWMGVGADGRFAVLTNYRESSDDDPVHPVAGVRSRGGMVTAWLASPPHERLDHFVRRMLEGRLVKGVGGFSLICGDLRRRTPPAPAPPGGQPDAGSIEPLAIISNRTDHPDMVPRIAGERGRTWGLSNAVYADEPGWPKIRKGQRLLDEAVRNAVARGLDDPDALADHLFTAVLDDDTLPLVPGMSFTEFMDSLRESVFVPAFSDEEVRKDMAEAVQSGAAKAAFDAIEDIESGSEADEGEDHSHPADGTGTPPPPYFMKGAYGTQRQTILLCDWDGNVTYKERALWDAHGNQIERGKGDIVHRFRVPMEGEQQEEATAPAPAPASS